MAVQVQSYAVADVAALSANVTINKPTGTASGDLLVCITSTLSSTPTAVSITGFTTVKGTGNNYFSYRQADGTEGSTFTVNRTGSNSSVMTCIMVRLTGQSTALIDVYDGVAAAATSTHVLPSVTATAGGLLLSALFVSGNIAPTSTAPSGMAAAVDDSSPANSAIAYSTQTIAAGATGTKTWTSTSANNGTAGHIVIPAGPVNASGTGAVSLSASAAGQAGASGAASLALAGSGTAKAQTTSSGTLALTAAGSGSAQGAGSASVALAAAGSAQARSAGTGALSLSGAGAGTGSAAGAAALSLAGAGAAAAASGGSASLTLAASADASGSGSSLATLDLSAAGLITLNAGGAALIELTAEAWAAGRSAGTALLDLSAVAGASGSPSAAATLELTSAGDAWAVAASLALLELAAEGSAVAGVPPRDITVAVVLAPARQTAVIADPPSRTVELAPPRTSARIEEP